MQSGSINRVALENQLLFLECFHFFQNCFLLVDFLQTLSLQKASSIFKNCRKISDIQFELKPCFVFFCVVDSNLLWDQEIPRKSRFHTNRLATDPQILVVLKEGMTKVNITTSTFKRIRLT